MKAWDHAYLNSKGDTVTPLVIAGEASTKHASGYELTNDEAHVGPAGEVDAKHHGKHLACVRGRGGRKDSPGHAAENLTNEEDLNVGCEEDDEEEAGKHDE
jgi:hypothetical protein